MPTANLHSPNVDCTNAERFCKRTTAVGGEVATTDASYAIRFTATIDGASRTFESTFLGAE